MVQIRQKGPLDTRLDVIQRGYLRFATVMIPHLEQRRHVYTRQQGPVGQQRFPGSAVALSPVQPGICHLKDHVFAITDNQRIEKISNRFRVAGAGPPRDNEGVLLVAVLASQRNPRQVKHGQDVRIVQFVQQTEPENIELA